VAGSTGIFRRRDDEPRDDEPRDDESPAGRRRGSPLYAVGPPVALLLGAAAAFAIVVLPFVAIGGAATIRMLLLDQLGRPPLDVPLVVRLRAIEGGPGSLAARLLPAVVVVPLAVVAAAVTAALARVAPWARLWVLVFIVQVGFLLTSNVFFPHYAAWPAPAGALLWGTALAVVLERAHGPGRLRAFAAAGIVLVLVAVGVIDVRRTGTVLPLAQVRAAASTSRCVAADEPTLLLESGTFARDVVNRCPIVIDPTGVSYDTDRGHLVAGAVGHSRELAPGYQAAMLAYYGGAQLAMFARRASDGLSTATMHALRCRLPRVLRLGPLMLLLAPATGPPTCP
jgi:hypothetical protein